MQTNCCILILQSDQRATSNVILLKRNAHKSQLRNTIGCKSESGNANEMENDAS